MKRLLSLTMLAIALTTLVSGCGTFRNWFCNRGDNCDPCPNGGAPFYGGGGATSYMPSVPSTLPGPIEVLPQRAN